MPYIHLRNNFVEYEFSFETKYLIISGDSGAGKTTLVDLVREYENDNTVAECLGDNSIAELQSLDQLSGNGMIYFLDENSRFLRLNNTSDLFNNSNNYFVIMTRERKCTQFKLSLDSLVKFDIASDGKYHTVKKCFTIEPTITELGECILCEDSHSGKMFLEDVLGCNIASANGDKKFGISMKKLKMSSYTLVFDRAGIGYQYEKILIDAERFGYDIVSIIDWDSFECYILESPEYNMSISQYPDKEKNAERCFRQIIDSNYDKSYLPDSMKKPVYWKIKQAKDLLTKTSDNLKSMTIF